MNSLVILLGPTGVGKTELSLRVAEHFGSPIISSDSRQLYKDLPIGTAAPTVEQMARVRHYMVGTLSLTDYYSASSFEEDVMSLLKELHQTHPTVVMTGGSMMYIDAVTKGIDDIPTVTPEIRTAIYKQFEEEGLSPILAELKETDPIHYNEVDRNNYKRVIHAVEICRMTGKPYSSFRTNTRKERPFRIIQIGLTRDREELYDRINRRAGLAVAEFLLRLSLKLRLLDLNADDRCKALADILTAECRLIFLQKLIFLRIVIKSLRQSTLETSQMRTALRGIDIVDECVDIFRVGIVMLHRHLDKYLVLDALAVDNRFIELLIAPVQVGDKFLDTALIVKGLLMLHFSVIPQGDL